MVHALSEIRRVLAPAGILIDLRPLADNWPVEVVSLREVRRTGRVLDLPEQTNGDLSSNEAMREAERRGWFTREQEELFRYIYAWDTPSEMEEFVNDDWQDFIDLDEETKRVTRAVWAVADADSRVRIRMDVWIARCRKQTSITEMKQ
jgi:SAM-dependent methyltransferase